MKRVYFIICILGFIVSSCGKEEAKNVIDVYPVDFKIDLNNLDNALKTPGGIKTFEKPRLGNEQVGCSGLLVVCSPLSEINNPILFAYDLCCPHESQRNIKVTPSDKDGTAKCNKCGSVFDIYSGRGTVKSGPSGNPLQVYGVNSGSNGVFYVYRKNY